MAQCRGWRCRGRRSPGGRFGPGQGAQVHPEADLRILDPIATTAYITRNHGYMVYDMLFATDAKFQVQPQMVDKYEVSKDNLTYTFTLRDGLKFHDGAAGALGRLHRLDRALGQARRVRPAARRGDRVVDRGQRQDLPAEAEEAVRATCSMRSASRRRTCRSSCPSASPRPMPSQQITTRPARVRSRS